MKSGSLVGLDLLWVLGPEQWLRFISGTCPIRMSFGMACWQYYLHFLAYQECALKGAAECFARTENWEWNMFLIVLDSPYISLLGLSNVMEWNKSSNLLFVAMTGPSSGSNSRRYRHCPGGRVCLGQHEPNHEQSHGYQKPSPDCSVHAIYCWHFDSRHHSALPRWARRMLRFTGQRRIFVSQICVHCPTSTEWQCTLRVYPKWSTVRYASWCWTSQSLTTESAVVQALIFGYDCKKLNGGSILVSMFLPCRKMCFLAWTREKVCWLARSTWRRVVVLIDIRTCCCVWYFRWGVSSLRRRISSRTSTRA